MSRPGPSLGLRNVWKSAAKSWRATAEELEAALTAAHAREEELREALERIGWHGLTWHEARDVARAALADQGADSGKCPDCHGKGLTDQDDKPGIWLNVDGSTTECRTCRGSGVASPSKGDERWKLIAYCEAESERLAAMKFVDKLPYMLVNNVEQDGSVSWSISCVLAPPDERGKGDEQDK